MTEVERHHRSGIKFDWTVLRELTFLDEAPVGTELKLSDLRVSVDIRIWLSPDNNQCRTILSLQVAPPPGSSPPFGKLKATVEGQFTVETGITPTVNLPDFARQQAAAILFPFARQAIATVTSSARSGPILIPPINVVALANDLAKTSDGET